VNLAESLDISEKIARDAADIRARRYHGVRALISRASCVLLVATRRSDALAAADGPPICVAEAEENVAGAARVAFCRRCPS
jgi:hypothetical protein